MLNKYVLLIFNIMMSSLISGCGNAPSVKCVFPDATDTFAPSWVCGMPVDGYEISTVGFAMRSAAGDKFTKQMAATDARVKLAQTMIANVEDRLKAYADEVEPADLDNAPISKAISNESLLRSKIYKTVDSPNDGLYVLLVVEPRVFKNAVITLSEEVIKRNRVLWEQYKSQNGL